MDARAAIALVRDAAGRVLLVHQRGGPFAGSWLLPGGMLRSEESAGEAVARELQEETGLVATGGRVIASYRTRSTGLTARVPDDDLTVFMFALDADGPVVAEAGSAVGWFDPAAIPAAHPMLRRQLLDAGVGDGDEGAVADALRAAGIEVDRLT